MRWYIFGLVLILLFVFGDGKRRAYSHRDYERRIFHDLKKIVKENTVNRFNIDIRHFDREEMLLFPDVAFQTGDSDGPWTVMVHGWRYEGSKHKDWLGFSATRWVQRIARELLGSNEILYLNGSINRDRLRPFFVEDESDELIIIQLGDKTFPLKTGEHGEFYEELKVTNEEMKQLRQQKPGKVLNYEATGDNRDKTTGIIRLIEPREGISVISDIDDTIKISEVLDKVRLLANTFIHPFKAVPGKLV